MKEGQRGSRNVVTHMGDWSGRQDAGSGTKVESFVTARKISAEFPNPRNEKALTNQGSNVFKMAEAMGFELMDLLQSTVFKTVALNHSATPPFALRAP